MTPFQEVLGDTRDLPQKVRENHYALQDLRQEVEHAVKRGRSARSTNHLEKKEEPDRGTTRRYTQGR